MTSQWPSDYLSSRGSRQRAWWRNRRGALIAGTGAAVLAASLAVVVAKGSSTDARLTAVGARVSVASPHIAASARGTATTAITLDPPTTIAVTPHVRSPRPRVVPPVMPREVTPPVALPPVAPCVSAPSSRRAGRIAFTTGYGGEPAVATVDAAGQDRRIAVPGAWQPAWSPDGTQLAYVKPGGDGRGDLYIANADGTDERPVVVGAGPDTQPDWSPAGDRLAFTSERDGNPEIYTVGVDGAGLQRLTYGGDYDRDPAWSPDGSTIAFDAARDQTVWLMDADGGHQRTLSLPVISGDPAWSPDGRCLAFTAYEQEAGGFIMGRVWVARADGSDAVRITPEGTPYPEHDHQPMWSPDGSSLLFASARAAPPAESPNFADHLFLAGPDGGGFRRLGGNQAGDASAPSWQSFPG